MKILPTLLLLLILSACNNTTTEPTALAEEPISLNEIAKPINENPMKKDQSAVKKQNHEIAVTVPDSTWSMVIQDVLETDTAVAVIVRLNQKKGVMGMQVISELVTAVEFESEKSAKIYVLGKTWGWKNTEGYEFVDESFQFSGRQLAYEEVGASRKSGPKKKGLGSEL